MSQHLSPKTKLSLLYKWFHTCESSRVTQDIANSVTWVLHLESEILKSVDGKVPRALAHLLHRLSPKGHHAPPCSLCKFVQRTTWGHGYSPEWHMEQIYQRPTQKSPKHTENLIFILGVPYASLLFPKEDFPNLVIRLTRLRPDSLLMAKASVSTTDVYSLI